MHHYKKDYPRPQLVREQWGNLNGSWDFSFDDDKVGEKEEWFLDFPTSLTIQVPFTYETKLSGIGDETYHEVIWYKKEFEISKSEIENKRMLLHFEGVDYETKVWVNGTLIGSHSGAYARFSFDISNAIHEGMNSIIVRVKDSFDTQQPRGKQRWAKYNYGCWYVQTTGIWKSVWMEPVSKTYIENIKLTPHLVSGEIEINMELYQDYDQSDLMMDFEITYEDKLINRVSCQAIQGRVDTAINMIREDLFEWGIRKWMPNDPSLYDLKIILRKDQEEIDVVYSYFGMREVSVKGDKVLLNGAPLYQRLILDQGYWKDSHLTPPNEEALIEDINKIKELGYNGLRKHQKVEDERFLYWCDVKGMLVWSEMAAAYQFSDKAVEMFTKEWMEIVKQNYSHPSIITWTPFNESWGVPHIKTEKKHQHFTQAIYYITKSMDPYRPVIVNDGWEHTISDIITLHDYEELGHLFFEKYQKAKDGILNNSIYHCNDRSAFAEGHTYQGQPIIMSEYGGIAFNNEEEGWGYGNKVQSKEDFIKRFDEITTAIKKLPYVCGYCYTQVSDVQQEINGLMDMERNFKIEPSIIKEINERYVQPEYKI